MAEERLINGYSCKVIKGLFNVEVSGEGDRRALVYPYGYLTAKVQLVSGGLLFGGRVTNQFVISIEDIPLLLAALTAAQYGDANE